MMRMIPTRMHALMDYTVGVLLIAAPWIFQFADESNAAKDVIGQLKAPGFNLAPEELSRVAAICDPKLPEQLGLPPPGAAPSGGAEAPKPTKPTKPVKPPKRHR